MKLRIGKHELEFIGVRWLKEGQLGFITKERSPDYYGERILLRSNNLYDETVKEFLKRGESEMHTCESNGHKPGAWEMIQIAANTVQVHRCGYCGKIIATEDIPKPDEKAPIQRRRALTADQLEKLIKDWSLTPTPINCDSYQQLREMFEDRFAVTELSK